MQDGGSTDSSAKLNKGNEQRSTKEQFPKTVQAQRGIYQLRGQAEKEDLEKGLGS